MIAFYYIFFHTVFFFSNIPLLLLQWENISKENQTIWKTLELEKAWWSWQFREGSLTKFSHIDTTKLRKCQKKKKKKEILACWEMWFTTGVPPLGMRTLRILFQNHQLAIQKADYWSSSIKRKNKDRHGREGKAQGWLCVAKEGNRQRKA